MNYAQNSGFPQACAEIVVSQIATADIRFAQPPVPDNHSVLLPEIEHVVKASERRPPAVSATPTHSMDACARIHARTCACERARKHTHSCCTHAHTRERTRVCIHVLVYARAYIQTHKRACGRLFMCARAHTHTHMETRAYFYLCMRA